MAETGFEYKTDFKDAKTRGGLGVLVYLRGLHGRILCIPTVP